MKKTMKEAKCPYCKNIKKHEFGSDLQCLYGEYSPNEIKTTCSGCGKEFAISVEEKIIYKARKIKDI